MTDHEQEAMIRMAFGEAEPGDTPSGNAKELRQYQALKAGLRSLADVPECQLSTRRLTDAILAEKVKPQKVAWWWPVGLVSGAAAVVAAYFFFTPAGTVKTPVDAPLASRAPSATHENPGLTPAPDEIASTTGDTSPSATARAESLLDRSKNLVALNDTPRPSLSVSRRRAVARPKQSVPDVTAEIAMSMAGNVGGAPAMSALPAGIGGPAADSMATSARSLPGSDAKVVVVEPGTDPLTGAKEAQEVNRRDVVFGG